MEYGNATSTELSNRTFLTSTMLFSSGSTYAAPMNASDPCLMSSYAPSAVSSLASIFADWTSPPSSQTNLTNFMALLGVARPSSVTYYDTYHIGSLYYKYIYIVIHYLGSDLYTYALHYQLLDSFKSGSAVSHSLTYMVVIVEMI